MIGQRPLHRTQQWDVIKPQTLITPEQELLHIYDIDKDMHTLSAKGGGCSGAPLHGLIQYCEDHRLIANLGQRKKRLKPASQAGWLAGWPCPKINRKMVDTDKKRCAMASVSTVSKRGESFFSGHYGLKGDGQSQRQCVGV